MKPLIFLMFIAFAAEASLVITPPRLMHATIHENNLSWRVYEIKIQGNYKKCSIFVVDCSIKKVSSGFPALIYKLLSRINTRGIGNLLLNDIVQYGKNDLVIFNSNLYETINGSDSEDINAVGNNIITNKIPTQIKAYLTQDLQNLRDIIVLTKDISCYINKNANEFKYNAIFIKIKKFPINRCYLESAKIIPDEDEAGEELQHVTLFHELNHYRHFIKNVGTYDRNSCTSAKAMRHFMKNAEEELQEIGYTVVNGLGILDIVNESYYRIQSKCKYIRYPYEHFKKDKYLKKYPFQITQFIKNCNKECLIKILQNPIKNAPQNILTYIKQMYTINN